MVGYAPTNASLRLMNKDEYVDLDLSEFVRTLVLTYTAFEVRDRQCTYACRYGVRRGAPGAPCSRADIERHRFPPPPAAGLDGQRHARTSDHASWGYADYPATALFEAVPNPRCERAHGDPTRSMRPR